MSESISTLRELINKYYGSNEIGDDCVYADTDSIKCWHDLSAWIDAYNQQIIKRREEHGQWILDIDDSFPLLRRGWRCSECGRRQTYGTTTYCPYCGRKMEVKR